MNFIETFGGDTPLFDTENSKKYKNTLIELNTLINSLCNAYSQINEYINSKDVHELISITKGLCDYMFYAEDLHLNELLQKLKVSEENIIHQFHDTKYMILDKLSLIENPTEAIVCTHELRNKTFVKCEESNMLVIIGEHHNIIPDIKDIIEELRIDGIFDSIEPMEVSFNINVINENINNSKEVAYNLFKDKPSKLEKVRAVIDRLEASSIKVVSFYAYKDKLEYIGCDEKQLETQEYEISKEYIPLKKWIQNTLNIELKDICEKVVDEESYNPLSVSDDENETYIDKDYSHIEDSLGTGVEESKSQYLNEENLYISEEEIDNKNEQHHTSTMDAILSNDFSDFTKEKPKMNSFEKAQIDILNKKIQPKEKYDKEIFETPITKTAELQQDLVFAEDTSEEIDERHFNNLKELMEHIESKKINDDDENAKFEYDEI